MPPSFERSGAGSPGPLFETARSRLIAATPSVASDLLADLFDEPPRDNDTLTAEVRGYIEELERLADAGLEFLDLATARRVGRQCLALLERAAGSDSAEVCRLVQVAARYFIEDDDAEGDTTSPIGFDDDAEVVELVARELGWGDLVE